ncbi:TetR/AcrR family transcriptional regulator [Lederbergia lenta]|uniref:TetR family transcriptional regulator n=1 Tax=Lederbergia lenta TaxID=1467 RepID=A0A2X4VXU9_LEDLE|nr:TetR/AcrR family transcriptional regulator [Lederbergia lenta]MEC2323769.1 helix-turn-helix domain containing protein [Lederbergia lenta]SQI51472.1 TetR family transcriptional regulator [Lederbergia lenta]
MSKQELNLKELFIQEDGLTEKQKNILAAATEAFAEKGFAATSTSEIAKKAGVAEGTIFRHYKTKKDLLLSIVSPMMVKLMAPIIMKDLNKVLDHRYEKFEDFLRAMLENRAKFLQENLPIIRILIQEIPFHAELKEQFIEHIGIRVLTRFKEIIEYYQAKEQIIDLPSETVIRLTASTALGLFATKYVIAPEDGWDECVEVERTIQFLMCGLSPR